jgi:aspartyl-tRNA(Asn)/glutamyl-tRNA(Gln) amidotransferase subunit B
MVSSGEISGRSAKQVINVIWEFASASGPVNDGKMPLWIVIEQGLLQQADHSVIEKLVDDIVAKNPDKAEQARAKPAMLGWFVGQVIKASGGKANPQAVNDLLRTKLGI